MLEVDGDVARPDCLAEFFAGDECTSSPNQQFEDAKRLWTQRHPFAATTQDVIRRVEFELGKFQNLACMALSRLPSPRNYPKFTFRALPATWISAGRVSREKGRS